MGFLAAVALQKRTLQGTRSELHQAFHSAMAKAQQNEFVDLEALDIDFDPLYEVSPWFDRALTRAQRDLLVSFPNPSYERIHISYNAKEAQELLARLGHREEFENIAKIFLDTLQH
jgi:hypothetical protein